MTTSREISIPLNDGSRVSAILTPPGTGTTVRPKGIILAHGAANDMHNDLLAYLAAGVAQNGITALRFNFLYRDAGKKSPDPQKCLEQTWIDVFAWFRKAFGTKGNIAAAGKSLGARIASQTAAAGRLAAHRLVFLGYPLHAPGKPDQLRDQHLYNIKVPMLFFTGTRDVFCRLDRLEKVTQKLPAPWQKKIIEGADHSFGLVKSDLRPAEEVYGKILDALLDWM